MTDFPRLIEFAFPLKQTSLDSVHEKMCHSGHIKAIHIWPARRPLAACRAALIATLLPDPGDAEKRRELCEKFAGKLVKKIERKKMPNGQIVERVKEETEGGILHWGRETENAETLEWFRQEIEKAYGGRAPKVLDPFAGGGAIPLEAMRLGCEATAVDINPVAWFILKCTLEYPQKLAGQTRPMPEFILHDDTFMAEFFKKAKGYSKAETTAAIKRLHERLKKKRKVSSKGKQGMLPFAPADGTEASEIEADLAWHVRAWGQWVLDRARRELAPYYPTYADFEPITKDHIAFEHRPLAPIPLKSEGLFDIDALNHDFTSDYLEDKRNPRWIAKPTVAYLWARTVTCKNCRAQIPLLKSHWLRRKERHRTLLITTPNEDNGGMTFGVQNNVPVVGGNAAQRREHDKRLGSGTVSKAGAKCPCCKTIMTSEDTRLEAMAERMGLVSTCVVVSEQKGKSFRPLMPEEHAAAKSVAKTLDACFASIPFGLPTEPMPKGGSRRGGGSPFTVFLYGLDQWCKLFTTRQLLALGTFCNGIREARQQLLSTGAADTFSDAVVAYLACVLDKVADYNSALVDWQPGGAKGGHTFQRWALPLKWDFTENSILYSDSGGWHAVLDWVTKPIETALARVGRTALLPSLIRESAIQYEGSVDIIVTDPPYYDAIPYSDCMDFFHVWLRRTLHGLAPDIDEAFREPLSPKWDNDSKDGELIDDSSRHGNSTDASKQAYEEGMFRAFQACHRALTPEGILVIVFAHKDPNAWETLMAAMIRAGFTVDASWPIQTEMGNRTRAMASAALASSVWLVCRKRSITARPGWDNIVLQDMRSNIHDRLREFWDAGIRGPDFVWAATGPALQAYSKHPVVRKANEPNSTMGVGEFLAQVRRMVVDYIVGQVLTGEHGADMAAADRLDEVTAYYLLHRHDFGMNDAPVGACILYATACGLSDTELDKTWDILVSSGKTAEETEDEEFEAEESEPEDSDADSSGGGKVKLKPWNQRRGKSLGYESPQGKAVPLIDRIHRVMHLWKEGDLHKVDEYLDQHALRRHELFKRVVQSLVELSTNSERSLLESISTHIGAKGAAVDRGPTLPFGEE